MRVCITGGTGLVGSALREMCPEGSTFEIINSKVVDLRNLEATIEWFKRADPFDAIFHCAARVGGLYRNMREPVDMIDDNLRMNMNVLAAAHHVGINKVVCVLSTCIFPDDVEYPIKVHDLHKGPPHFSNEGYAYAKRMLEVQCRAYQRQYNRQFMCVVPTNIYGRHDNFHPEDSHVVPALIRKAVLASREASPLVVLGNGLQWRQFIHSCDLANILWWAIEHYTHIDVPLVCCPSEEVRIRDIVELIASYKGVPIEYKQAEGGQMRKACTDTNTQLKELGYNVTFTFRDLGDGLRDTMDWYERTSLA